MLFAAHGYIWQKKGFWDPPGFEKAQMLFAAHGYIWQKKKIQMLFAAHGVLGQFGEESTYIIDIFRLGCTNRLLAL